MKPHLGGGANWPPSSYNPVTGVYYVCATDGVGVFSGGDSFATVTGGRNDMPSFADEIRAVVAYVRRMIESR